MKILIVSPSFSLLGGVANHFFGLDEYWTNDVNYVFYGKRKYIPAFITFTFDLFIFILKILFNRPDIVIVNPSFRRYQLLRDAIYIIIASILKIEVVCFFHGWDKILAKKVEIKPAIFKRIYNRTSLILVLGSEFKTSLIKMGISKRILLTSTKINNKLLEGFDILCRKEQSIDEILYLGRIVESKGIFVALQTFHYLQKDFPDLKFRIVGDGKDLNRMKKLVKENNISNVIFVDPIFDNTICEQFKSSQLFIQPSYGEGMSTSVLEAMAFGLPIITSPIGGILDFFEDEKMGYLIDGFDHINYANAIKKIILNKEIFYKISIFNHNYSTSHFLASQVVKNLEKYFLELLSNANYEK